MRVQEPQAPEKIDDRQLGSIAYRQLATRGFTRGAANALPNQLSLCLPETARIE